MHIHIHARTPWESAPQMVAIAPQRLAGSWLPRQWEVAHRQLLAMTWCSGLNPKGLPVIFSLICLFICIFIYLFIVSVLPERKHGCDGCVSYFLVYWFFKLLGGHTYTKLHKAMRQNVCHTDKESHHPVRQGLQLLRHNCMRLSRWCGENGSV